ncbi:hypothetical protein WMF37_15015 [Sorangium sp. So ce291]|uniref:hypothetical protein n=1 Tax=Sorangium sp. So ce291 TaxID=3133294 RepID=UPI003F61CD8A
MNLLPNYITVSSSSGGGEGGDVGTTTSVTTTSAGGEGGAGGVACTCEEGLSCCGPTCVNLANDPHNCGTCGTTCEGAEACIQGECKSWCSPEFGCEEGICCGNECCGTPERPGTICCDYGTSAEAPVLRCQDPVNGTCPVACSGCEN